MEKTLERILSLIPKDNRGKYAYGAKAEFCRAVGIENPNVIWDWETGRTKSYNYYLHQIADAYNVNVAWLKGETDERQPAQQKSRPSHDQLIDAIVESLDREQLLDLIQRATEMLRGK